ncbi:MAG: hypothetical protein R3275_12645, partial [Saprospiraceae bacterium]|nr:hypothetical protein [Saprospiraceae bacterium]
NRHTNFDRQVYYSGTTQGSITDQWLEEYQNSDELLPYSAGLASGADIFVEDNTGQVTTDYELDGRLPQKKQENISSTGGHGEMVVGFAANYDHKIYFGLTLGIPIVSYELNRQYQENQEMVDNSIFFDQLNYNERLEQSGAGINAKLGMIYRVNQMLRLSAYYHTPSVISLLDEFNNSLDYSYYDQNRNIVTATNSYPPNGETLNFEYQIVTPGQVGGGASVIIGKGGFVSGEVSYTNYSSARFDFDSDLSTSDDLEYERELNQRIDDTYGGAWTFRLGGELALDILRFRLGTILTQRPFANDNKLDPTYTGGLGLRFNKFFVDFAYRRATRKASYSPYTIADQNTFPVQKVSTEDINSDYFLTFGFRF